VQNLLTAAGIRMFVRSPFRLISPSRKPSSFVLIAVIIVPVGTAFWGAAFTVSNHFGTYYWVEWRNLSVSNGVTAIVLLPIILIGAQQSFAEAFKVAPRRMLEACFLAVGLLAVGLPRVRSVARGTGHFARAPLCTRSAAYLGGAALWAWRH